MTEPVAASSVLVLCYSLGGKTIGLCKRLVAAEGYDLEEVKPVKPISKVGAFFKIPMVMAGKGIAVNPIAADWNKYEKVIIAGPVWAGSPAPVLKGLFGQYPVRGKTVVGLLTCQGGAGASTGYMRDLISEGGGVCEDVIIISGKEPSGKALLEATGPVTMDKIIAARI